MNKFNLKKFRTEVLKMSQIEMAGAIGMRQDKLSRYEEHPETISLEDLMKIAERFGITLDQLLKFEKTVPAPLDVKNNWTGIKFVRSKLLKPIDEYLKWYGYTGCEVEEGEDTETLNIKEHTFASEKLNELKLAILNYTKKPKVVFLGRSDSGKSTMINALLGENRTPTNWTPTTSIVIYIKHLNDRPAYIKDDVLILKNDSNDTLWDDKKMYDKEYVSKLKIASGGIEILSSYGTGQGEQFRNRAEEISAAVLFVDSPILKNCDILDAPGYTGGRPMYNKAAEDAGYKADILVYLSQVNSFITEGDPDCIRNAMSNIATIEKKGENELPCLANLFVVATQSHIINGSLEKSRDEQIEEILDSGCSRFFDSLDEEFWNERKAEGGYEYSEEDLRKRFFSYSTDDNVLREGFENELKKIIEEIPLLIKKDIVGVIKDYANGIKSELSDERDCNEDLINKKREEKTACEAGVYESERAMFEFKEKKR